MKSYHPFTVGKFKCYAVSDGTNTYHNPAALLFPMADKEQLHHALQRYQLNPEEWKEFKNTYTPLLIDTGEDLILVDTGCGEGLSEDGGMLVQNLEEIDIFPEAIDHVILTHGHPDHLGGNTKPDGQSVFSNARYHMFEDEWNFWCTDQGKCEMERRGFHPEFQKAVLEIAKMNLLPIKGQIELIDGDKEILPGIHLIKSVGHTPGHMILRIESEGESLYSFSDLFIHPIHMEHPEWCTAVDIDHELMKKTRRDLLQRAEKENSLTHGFHLPFPGLGTIKEKNEAWHWVPTT